MPGSRAPTARVGVHAVLLEAPRPVQGCAAAEKREQRRRRHAVPDDRAPSSAQALPTVDDFTAWEREVTDSVGLTDASFIGRSCHCGQLAAEWADTRLCIDRDNQRAAEQTAAETYEDREQAIRRMHDDAVSDHDR